MAIPAGNEKSGTPPVDILVSHPEIRDALSGLGVFVRDLATGESFPNYIWTDLGYRPDELTEDFWLSVLHPDDRERAERSYERVLSGETATYRITYRIRSRSGAWHWIMNAGRVVSWDQDGKPRYFVGADVDITDRYTMEQALEKAKAEAEQQAQEADALRMAGAIVASTLEVEKTVELVLEQAQHVVSYDTATVQLLRNDALEVIGGAGWEDIDAILGVRVPYPGNSPHSAALDARRTVQVQDMQEEYPEYANIAGTAIRSWIGVPLLVHGEKMGLITMDSTHPNFFTPTDVRLATALGDHVAVALHNARLYEQTRELAMTDSLTGVSTRRSFFVQAEAALIQAVQNNEEISVIMVDLDHFKSINDEFGHASGDDAIRLAADAARQTLRRTDVIGRYGGEEFAVVLPRSGKKASHTIAERLRERIAGITVPGTSRKLSASVGLTTRRAAETDTVDAILEEADQALLQAKRAGRNTVTVFQTTSA
jgi:diguanylate cyclase (GGDEF)-like protein/PAS domain S-box-containing protein